jgi:fatty acid desaturase
MSPQSAPLMNFDESARELLRDLHTPRSLIFWADLLVTACIAWIAFSTSVLLDSWLTIAAVGIAGLAFYRGLCFIHELTHLRPAALPGFDLAWNLLFGAPLLMPSFVYTGVHQDHHKLSTYGTRQDPEYLPFARSDIATVLFAVASVFIPVFLLMRFVVVTPIALLVRPLHQWLAIRASALSMNAEYRRVVSNSLLRTMKLWEVSSLALWLSALFSMYRGILPWRMLAIWYGTSVITSFVNALRTLGAHHYESDGAPLDRNGQLIDSVDTPGNLFTELWAPVGLRYHALHHYFPGIPYHNLPEAHRRLVTALPENAPYRMTLSSGLWNSLYTLVRRGKQGRTRGPRKLSPAGAGGA